MRKASSALSVLAIFFVASCGGGDDGSDVDAETDASDDNGSNAEASEEDDGDTEDHDEEGAQEEEEEDDEAVEVSDDSEGGVSEDENVEDDWDTQVGETIENEGGTFTLHARQDDIDTIETGPVVLEIEQINAASGELSPDLAEMMETDTLDYVQVDVVVENTSDEDIIFYVSEPVIVTSTGEQLESDMWLSDYISGDMMSGTSHTGSLFFALENSNAEDVESVRATWDAPTNEDWDDIGEDIDIEVSF